MQQIILPRHDDTQHMTFEGKRVVPLNRDGEYYFFVEYCDVFCYADAKTDKGKGG